jgi:hypothetical protein
MIESLKQEWRRRPWWMNLTWFFCVYMTFVYMPFDMFTKPFERWEEVWFGIVITGWPAKLTEPLHWLIYGAGAYGFWKMRPWMWPWAAVYAAQVAIAMFVFNILEAPVPGEAVEARGGGLLVSVITAPFFIGLTVALWRAKELFSGIAGSVPTDATAVAGKDDSDTTLPR